MRCIASFWLTEVKGNSVALKKQSDRLVLRIPPWLLKLCRREANADHRTLSAWVRLTLERAVHREGNIPSSWGSKTEIRKLAD